MDPDTGFYSMQTLERCLFGFKPLTIALGIKQESSLNLLLSKETTL